MKIRLTPMLNALALAAALLLPAMLSPAAQAQSASPRPGTAQQSQPSPTGDTSGTALAGVDYPLGAGDVIKVQVFQSPDLSVEARVSEGGYISYPLLGAVRIGGLSPSQAERLIASRLRDGNFLQNPQVTLNVVQFRSQQVSVLGNVGKPGRYPLETTGMRLSEVLAMAGGVAASGSDTVILISQRDGRPERTEIDVAEMFLAGQTSKDVAIRAGDTIYVHRAPVYYIYGQVQRPGNYQIERSMTVAQAIAKGGGVTLRGTDKGVRVQRRDAAGTIQTLEPKLEDPVKPDDLIFVRESLF